MSRILFFIGLIVVIAVGWAVSRRRNQLTNKERVELEAYRLRDKAERDRSRRTAALGETMCRCEECGTYFPKSEAVRSGSHVYCSTRCRDAAAASGKAD